MINIKDYPQFEFFMLGIMDYCSDFSDGTKMFKELTSKESQLALKNEIIRLKEYEAWEIQAFMIRSHLGGPKQKRIPVIFNTILEELENK